MKLRRTFSLRLLLVFMTVTALVMFALSPGTIKVRIAHSDAIQVFLEPGDWIDIIAVDPDGSGTTTIVNSVQIDQIELEIDGLGVAAGSSTVTVKVSNFQKWRLRGDTDYRIALLSDPR